MTLDGTASRNELSNWSSQIAPTGALSTSGNKNMRVVISGKEAGNSYAFCQELHDGRGGGIALDGLGTVRLKRQKASLLPERADSPPQLPFRETIGRCCYARVMLRNESCSAAFSERGYDEVIPVIISTGQSTDDMKIDAPVRKLCLT
jgi:hypothetical protein